MDQPTINPMLSGVADVLPDPGRIYTPAGLRLYDAFVMGLLAERAWGCPARHFVDCYREHLKPSHADIGVGTGYCLDRCEPGPIERLALFDLRQSCLDYCAHRLRRFRPETYVRDARAPIQIDTHCFESIGLGGLLHSLPGSMRDKSRVFDAITPLASPGATVFGYTLVRDGVHESLPRRLAHRLLNRLRVIDTDNDHMTDLAAELSRRFTDCRLRLIGNVAFFSAVVRSRSAFKHSPGDLI